MMDCRCRIVVLHREHLKIFKIIQNFSMKVIVETIKSMNDFVMEDALLLM
jgi:hypothetical protein